MGYAIAGEPDFADDGIHIEAWNFVTKLVSAAHESDMAHFGEILRRFEEMTELTEQANTPFIYLMYALHDHISRICRRGVHREELLSISSDMYPLVNQRLEIEKASLDDLVLGIFDQSDYLSENAGELFIIESAVTLGVLMVNPEKELSYLRSAVASRTRQSGLHSGLQRRTSANLA